MLIRRAGYIVNRKLVYRIYREEKLSLLVRKRKRIAALVRVPLPTPAKSNVRWSMDFVSDQLGEQVRSAMQLAKSPRDNESSGYCYLEGIP